MNNFKPGKWLALCDRCGFQRLAPDELVETWDGYKVCAPSTGKTCFETKHPQLMVRARPDDQSVPYVRPYKETFLTQTLNCDCFETRVYNPVFSADETIMKGTVRGPMLVTAGTITVVCTLEVM